jgi:hypothetical protein
MKEIYVIRMGQSYYGITKKVVVFDSLTSGNTIRFQSYNDAEYALKSLPLPAHCKGDLFQIVKFFEVQ